MSVFLQEFVRLFYGRVPGFPDARRAIPFPQIDFVTGPAIQLGPLTIQRAALFTMIALVICWGFLYVFVNRTQMGRAMQATSQDPDTSRLMGINVDRIIMVAFALGAALAAVAGLAWGLRYTNIDFRMGFLAGLKAFTAAVLGGIGNINGAVVGGLVLGLVEGMVSLHPRHFWRLGVEGRLGVRVADFGAGLPTTGPAWRKGGGPSMISIPQVVTPERQQRTDPTGRLVGIAGGVVLAASAFLPWAYSFEALDGMTLLGYPSPLQYFGMVLGLLVAGLIICSRLIKPRGKIRVGWVRGAKAAATGALVYMALIVLEHRA